MKRRSFALLLVIVSSFSLHAQLVVAAPDVETTIAAQTTLMTNFALQEKFDRAEQFAEYISRFIQIISTIRNTTSTIRNIAKAGKELKNKDAKAWLKEVDSKLSQVMPEYGEMKGELLTLAGEAGQKVGGMYSDYVSKWSPKVKGYYEGLVENCSNNKMFAELYPVAKKIGGEFRKNESAMKIVQKAWVESGLEYQIKDDIVRKNTFKKYYDAFMKQAKSNDNIEAIGLANIMQSQYISVEVLEHLKKNSDIKAMREQFERDAQKAYRDLMDEISEKTKNKDVESVFGIESSKK